MPRLVWNAASQILMFFGNDALAMGLPRFLYIGLMLVGICYGVRLTIYTISRFRTIWTQILWFILKHPHSQPFY